jgi:hypothetical protein
VTARGDPGRGGGAKKVLSYPAVVGVVDSDANVKDLLAAVAAVTKCLTKIQEEKTITDPGVLKMLKAIDNMTRISAAMVVGMANGILKTASQFATPTLEHHNSRTKQVIDYKSLQVEIYFCPKNIVARKIF